jgi:hypothetical protein
MKLNRLLTIILLCITSFSYAQPRCGFDEHHKEKLRTDPTYKRSVEAEGEKIRQFIKQKKDLSKIQPLSATAIFKIPVVVHVIHTGGAVGTIYNPTDVQIEGAIDYLNQVYAGTLPGTEGVGDMQIQFALAERDPNCNPTNGINRVNGSGVSNYTANGVVTTAGSNEVAVKNLIRWNTSQYYNIWIVNKIDGKDGTSGSFVAGFAYFPGASSLLDGTIMLATQMKFGEKTLPHEIGHALALHHPFYDPEGDTCPTNNDCSVDGDGVCDTDPVPEPTNLAICRSGTNPCTNTAYSINTEKNYMNYNSCYTLFTSGQKARALAAMGLASRASLATSLGGTPPNAGSTTCVPKINFEFADDQKSEATAATADCRSYTDYTYKMVIGNSPSATASATLTLGGTATETVDYDVTTNGNFATPSKVITFPAGSTSSQNFTIRVYNDAIVDASETIIAGFTLNNGGGNAVIGNGRPNFTFTITDNDVAPISGTSTGQGSIGTSTYGVTDLFDARKQKQRTVFLYKASELISAGIPAGDISGISLFLQKNSTRPYSNFIIKIGTTNVNYLADGAVTIPTNTIVKSLTSYTTLNGWNNFNFDIPFIWNGTSNLVFEICFDNGTTATDAADIVSYFNDASSTGPQRNLLFQNGINCSESFSTLSAYGIDVKPMVSITYGIPPTLVQSTINSSKQEYLGPNADIYFYDQTDNRLLARIKNLTNHNYGCTQVIIDRAGTGTTAFTTNSVSQHLLNKTFRIVPTNNNTSGQYEVTLYYSAAEKSGWESATGLNWNDILLVKVPSQILNYSVSTPLPDGTGVVVTATPIRSTLGSQFALTGSFNTGFSGFGAGIPATVLPVTLTTFDGKLHSGKVSLNWATSLELNTKQFEVEKSIDGVSFTRIGNVQAYGNSSTNRNYYFADDNVLPNNFYRLRIVDTDGAFTYSRIISIKYDQRPQSVWVENNSIINQFVNINVAKKAQKVQLQLLSSTSSLIAQKEIMNASTVIKWQLPNYLSRGIYFLKATADGQEFIIKLIKE